jgi:hypothetical protein
VICAALPEAADMALDVSDLAVVLFTMGQKNDE